MDAARGLGKHLSRGKNRHEKEAHYANPGGAAWDKAIAIASPLPELLPESNTSTVESKTKTEVEEIICDGCIKQLGSGSQAEKNSSMNEEKKQSVSSFGSRSLYCLFSPTFFMARSVDK